MSILKLWEEERAETKSLSPDTETQKPKSSNNFAQLLWPALFVILFFGLRAYNDWKFNNEPVTGIGVSYTEIVTKSKLVVDKVHENTPAFQAGLQKGDIITEVNGKETVTASDFPEALKNLPAGSKLNLTILRDGKKLNIATEVAILKRKDFK